MKHLKMDEGDYGRALIFLGMDAADISGIGRRAARRIVQESIIVDGRTQTGRIHRNTAIAMEAYDRAKASILADRLKRNGFGS